MPPKASRPTPCKVGEKKPYDRDTISSGPVSREVSEERAHMPHERDERVEPPHKAPDTDIEQALRDVESGQTDTDLRGTAGRASSGSQGKPTKKPSA